MSSEKLASEPNRQITQYWAQSSTRSWPSEFVSFDLDGSELGRYAQLIDWSQAPIVAADHGFGADKKSLQRDESPLTGGIEPLKEKVQMTRTN